MTAFLIITGLAVLWAVSLLVKPFGRCLLCRGGRVRVSGRRARKCTLCKAHALTLPQRAVRSSEAPA